MCSPYLAAAIACGRLISETSSSTVSGLVSQERMRRGNGLIERLRRRDRRRLGLGRQLLGESSVRVPHAQPRAMRQRRHADALAVYVRSVRAREVVQHEKPSLEDDLAVMPRHFRIAQDDVVAWVATEGERSMRLQPVAFLRAVEADEEDLGHSRAILAYLPAAADFGD